MPWDIFIILIRAVGRYLVVVFNLGLAQEKVKLFLSQNYDNVTVSQQAISFTLEVHEDPVQVAQQIFKIYELNQKPKP